MALTRPNRLDPAAGRIRRRIATWPEVVSDSCAGRLFGGFAGFRQRKADFAQLGQYLLIVHQAVSTSVLVFGVSAGFPF